MKRRRYSSPANANITFKDWIIPILGLSIGWFLVAGLFMHVYLEDLEGSTAGPEASLERATADLAYWKAHRLITEEVMAQRREHSRGAQLKQRYERDFPPSDRKRIRSFVHEELQVDLPKPRGSLPYDVYNCPISPPDGYPFSWNVQKVLSHWNPNTTTIPNDFLHQSLCVFDYERDFDKALTYRIDELPFVLVNVPTLQQTAERWNRNESYLLELLGGQTFKTEHATNQHFMYWKLRRNAASPPNDWKQPTDMMELSYQDWLAKAKTYEEPSNRDKIPKELWYFRLNAALHQKQTFLYDELPLFDPIRHDHDATFFMVEPYEERGINCRFGMKGIIAEAHFDGSRNFVVVLGGQRRYILAHPDQCEYMELYDLQHPSSRHSSVDWTKLPIDPDRPFAQLSVHEVVLQAGEALYLPTYYFHFIVNLNRNFQCNARSGMTDDYKEYIQECGFGQ